MANTLPIAPSTVRTTVTTISTANTNRDGTGTIVDCMTGVAAGTRIDKIVATATVTTAAGVVRIYLYDGSTYFLFKEIMVTAITPSTSIEVARYELFNTDGTPLLYLPSASYKISAAPHNAENWKITVLGGDYT